MRRGTGLFSKGHLTFFADLTKIRFASGPSPGLLAAKRIPSPVVLSGRRCATVGSPAVSPPFNDSGVIKEASHKSTD